MDGTTVVCVHCMVVTANGCFPTAGEGMNKFIISDSKGAKNRVILLYIRIVCSSKSATTKNKIINKARNSSVSFR